MQPPRKPGRGGGSLAERRQRKRIPRSYATGEDGPPGSQNKRLRLQGVKSLGPVKGVVGGATMTASWEGP